MEKITLTDEEAQFAVVLQDQFKQVFVPVPFFIRSVSLLQYMNTERIMAIAEKMKEDDNFLESVGMSRERLKIIVMTSASFALWKRGVLMRLQWILQFVALFFIWKILCLL